MLAYVFPGQGSQQKGMGSELFGEFKELTAVADQVLGYSIVDLCLHDAQNLLGRTNYTQPALFTVNALMYLKKTRLTGEKPDYMAGHSLGEYSALFAAGAFDFETGLKIVKKRGELMSAATGGGMAAVIGLTEAEIRRIIADNQLNAIDVANLNTPKQIVISAPKAEIEKAQPIFEAAGATRYVVLNVSGAFHSRYMEDARIEFERYLDQFTFSQLNIPVISNVTARPYQVSELKKNMILQVTHSVKWDETIRYLMGKGIADIFQIGPGNILTGMVNTIKREAEPLIVPEEAEVAAVSEAVVFSETKTVLPVEPPLSLNEKRKESERTDCEGGNGNLHISAASLGSAEFKKDYGLKYAYVTGGMYRGIASREMVVQVGKSGMLGFLGTGGMDLERLETEIQSIQNELKKGEAYGLNLLHHPENPRREEEMVDLFSRYGIKNIEAAAFISLTPALVKYRLQGLANNEDGTVTTRNRILAKVSRPEVAEAFLSPPPERIVKVLLEQNKITPQQAEMARQIPMADDITVEADSGGHTDGGVAYALMASVQKLRDELMERYRYSKRVRIGAAGGIGAPAAVAAALILGADYIVTGSINQCTVEAGTSNLVKDMLQKINVQDTDYCPAGDMFEIGAKVQVLKSGVFFPARANKLYELYKQYNSIEEIDAQTQKQIQEKYFKKSFETIFTECKSFYPVEAIERAEKNPKQKMAMIFKWYFGYSTQLALQGVEENKVDFQVHCGPALGAFNQWVKGTELEDWRNRHVNEIGIRLMEGAAEVLNQKFKSLFGGKAPTV